MYIVESSETTCLTSDLKLNIDDDIVQSLL